MIQVDILQIQKSTVGYCTNTHSLTHSNTHTHTGGAGGYYMQIWRDEFLRLAWKKMLILSDKHHTVMSSTLSGPWKKKLVVQRSLFLWKVSRRFWCQKWSEVVWMDGRQSGVQKDRLGNFQWKNCSTELQLYTGFLRLLVASEVSEGGVWCVRAWELWRQVWLPNFGPFGVCQNVLENLNLIEENYSSQVLTKQRHRGGFLQHQ